MEINLAGKSLLVTAGTSALGERIVIRALEEKASVFFTYHENESKARALEGRGAKPVCADLRKPEEIEKIKGALKEAGPSLDALINNAGIVRDKTLGNMSDEDFDEVIAVDLTAAFKLTKKLLPLLYKSEAGKIVNITSRVGFQGGFGEANYAAAKAGLASFTKSLAAEVGRKGIAVNAVAPGFMMSKMTESLPEAVYEKQKNESYLGELSDPAVLADFIVYMLSDRFRGVTGQVFFFDSRKTRMF